MDASDARRTARDIERKLLLGCGDNSCRFYKGPPRGMGTNGGCRCRDVIQDALESASAPRWIPVSERLPENPTIGVLVWHKSGVFSLASWYGNREPHECLADEQCGWRQWRVWQVLHPDYGGGIHANEPGDEITHWQPLPEPPKE